MVISRTNWACNGCGQACAYGHGPVVEALLEAKADIDQQSQPYEEGSPEWDPRNVPFLTGNHSEVMVPPELLALTVAADRASGAPPPASFR